MHTSEVERLLTSAGGSPGREWPPKTEAPAWEIARERRRRYDNDPADLWRYRTDLHVPEDTAATAARFRDYTPVPLARDIARFSSQLLFSDPPALTLDDEVAQAALDAWYKFNTLDEFLADAGDNVAAEGSGALRVIRDDHVSERFPLIVFEPADKVIWASRHKRFVSGGVVVVERGPSEGEDTGVRWRMLEYHEAGRVRRALYKGGISRLGNRVPLRAGPLEFRELRDEVRTGVDRPTLIPWLNVPGGHSDIAGLDGLLKAADDGESIFRQKIRASKPLKFVHRKLADRKGNADLDAAIIVGDGSMNPVEQPETLAQVIQGRAEAEDHRVYLDHVRELAVGLAGYSLASWGYGDGGRADSGRALKLRQVRTLLTRSGKVRMSQAAISEAAGIALAMMLDRPAVEPLKPTVELGEGFPFDPLDAAEQAMMLRNADAASTEEIVRIVHPDWNDDQVESEAAKIDERLAPPSFSTRGALLNGAADRMNLE